MKPHLSTPRARALLAGAALLPMLAVGLTWGSGTAAAATTRGFHVSPSGDDAADGSAAHPWRSIAAATAAAPAGATILVDGGSYGPFTITQPGQTVIASPGQQVVVRGAAGVQDVIRVAASAVTVSGLTVTGCVPNPNPPGRLEDVGSSDVRIDDDTTGVTLHGLTISASTGTNAYGLPVGCYGVFAHNARAFRVVGNDISGTGLGVYVNGDGQQGVVADNTIHDNHVIIRNTPGGNDDFGGSGVTFAAVDAVPGVLATHNTVDHNYGPSSDYGTDGGAFEIYDASNTQIVANTMSDNDDVLETGTGPGGACVGNVFSGNQASGLTPGSGLGRSLGLLLRCATAMVVSDNSLTDLDYWAYDLETGDQFSTDVNGLAITGNTVTQSQPVYRLAVDPLAAKLVVQGNHVAESGPIFATYGDGTSSPDLAGWQQRTGQDLASVGE